MPDRSPLMSAQKTGTPAREKPSAMVCRVTVLPVPVAPATSPCRLARESSNSQGLSPRPIRMLSVIVTSLPGPARPASSASDLPQELLQFGCTVRRPPHDTIRRDDAGERPALRFELALCHAGTVAVGDSGTLRLPQQRLGLGGPERIAHDASIGGVEPLVPAGGLLAAAGDHG